MSEEGKTRDEVIDLIRVGHYDSLTPDQGRDILDLIEDTMEAHGFAPWRDSPALSASVSRLDARMEATGLIRPLEERIARALHKTDRDLAGSSWRIQRDRARDVIRLAGLDANPLDAPIPPFLCPRCGADKCHRCGWNGTEASAAASASEAEAWGDREAKLLFQAAEDDGTLFKGQRTKQRWLAVARKAGEIAAERQSRELREARETVARQGLQLLSFHNDESQEAAVWRGMILQDPGAKAEWESIKGDRDEFSADDAASLVAGLIEDRTILRNDLARVTRECQTANDRSVDFERAWIAAQGELKAKTAECERLRVDLDIARRITVSSLPAEDLAAARAAGFEAGRDAAATFLIEHREDCLDWAAEQLRAIRPPSEPQGGEG